MMKLVDDGVRRYRTQSRSGDLAFASKMEKGGRDTA